MQNRIRRGLKGKELMMESRGLRWSKQTPLMQHVWHGGRRSPGQDPAQGDGVTCTCTRPSRLVMNHVVGRCEQEIRSRISNNTVLRAQPEESCAQAVSSKGSSPYLCWIVRHLGFFGHKPRSPVYLPVLFSHSLVCVPTKRISPLCLFSLGKDGQGRSPQLPSAVLF